MRFNTEQFEFSHGRAPRGVGQWAFSFERSCDKVFWAPAAMSFSDAKKWAAKEAKAKQQTVVWVCP